jgi:drug/metabolite transporter (DMT)-like permease
MKSEHNTMNSGDIPTRPPGPADVNVAMGIREWGLILILSAIWGGSFFFVGVAVKEMTPLTIVLCRVGLASMILLVTFLIPVSAIFLGVMVLGERPGWNAFGGMALIFMGLMAIDGRLVKRFRGQPR